MIDFHQYLATSQQRVEAALERWLPAATAFPQRLHEAMRYSARAPGKRLRPVLVYATGSALAVPAAALDGVACAVELIHSYSLIHDDLPAMDNDDIRRGRPTCHRQFDEATAILAGDALQPLAFEIICTDQDLHVGAERRLAMLQTLANASGSRGMAGGQALDLDATGKSLSLPELENLHIHKTGALIRACSRLAALAAEDATDAACAAVDRYAKLIGLAFQIRDDVLDVEGTADTLGKTQGKDAAQSKTTYPVLLTLSGAQDKAEELVAEALRALAAFGPEAAPLRQLALHIINRSS